jgi:hypothetical protein
MNYFDAVLVDDDPLVRMSWKMVAQQKGKVILLCASVEDARLQLESVDRSVSIYLDSNLGSGMRGEEFALELSQKGFTEVFLATGYRSGFFTGASSEVGDSSPRLPQGVKGVIGKDPPF